MANARIKVVLTFSCDQPGDAQHDARVVRDTEPGTNLRPYLTVRTEPFVVDAARKSLKTAAVAENRLQVPAGVVADVGDRGAAAPNRSDSGPCHGQACPSDLVTVRRGNHGTNALKLTSEQPKRRGGPEPHCGAALRAGKTLRLASKRSRWQQHACFRSNDRERKLIQPGAIRR